MPATVLRVPDRATVADGPPAIGVEEEHIAQFRVPEKLLRARRVLGKRRGGKAQAGDGCRRC
ncbi:MAG: hypothetical protein MUF25_12715 [Pirellulaceae bacterium]|nr:hypothetical protein [Pirellulaceae bacterium]